MSALAKDINKEMTEVEAALNRIQTHKGVQGIVVTTHEGSVIRSSLDNIQTPQISTLVTQLAIR
jgi:dynein light chain roadblock-type